MAGNSNECDWAGAVQKMTRKQLIDSFMYLAEVSCEEDVIFSVAYGIDQTKACVLAPDDLIEVSGGFYIDSATDKKARAEYKKSRKILAIRAIRNGLIRKDSRTDLPPLDITHLISFANNRYNKGQNK